MDKMESELKNSQTSNHENLEYKAKMREKKRETQLLL